MNYLRITRLLALLMAAMWVAACSSSSDNSVGAGGSAGSRGLGGSGGAPADELGSYAVGHTMFTVVDSAREDRELLVDLWYPVTRSTP